MPSRDAVLRSITRCVRKPVFLEVAGHITQARGGLEPLHEARRPDTELFRVGILQAVLVLRAAYPIFDGQVLDRLHVECDAGNLGELGLQPANHVHRAGVPLFQRLEVDLDAAAVERGIGAIDADEGGQALHRGVLQDHLAERLLALRHRRKRDGLRGLGNAQNHTGILHREKALGNDQVEVAGEPESSERDHDGGETVPQHDRQGLAVKRDDAFENALGPAV